MAEAPINRRRWFQFRLRTLLILVSACAVLYWGYFLFWPWRSVYYQQVRFEQELKKIKVGTPYNEMLPPPWPTGLTQSWSGPWELWRFNLPKATYCILIQAEYTGNRPCKNVVVYRLAPPHPNTGITYASDFFAEIIANGNAPGYKYELIYSDPPK